MKQPGFFLADALAILDAAFGGRENGSYRSLSPPHAKADHDRDVAEKTSL